MTEPQPTHREIIQRVAALDREFVQHRQDSIAYRDETRDAIHRIADTLKIVAEQGERIEDRVLAYDRLRDRVLGGIAAAGVGLAALWWALHSKIETLLGIK